MRLQPSPLPDSAKLCSGGPVILVDEGAYGEVRSTTGNIRLFHQQDNGFACVRSRGTS